MHPGQPCRQGKAVGQELHVPNIKKWMLGKQTEMQTQTLILLRHGHNLLPLVPPRALLWGNHIIRLTPLVYESTMSDFNF